MSAKRKKDENFPFVLQYSTVTRGQIQAPSPHIQNKTPNKQTKIVEQRDTANTKIVT